jgi:hypothetical protein
MKHKSQAHRQQPEATMRVKKSEHAAPSLFSNKKAARQKCLAAFLATHIRSGT